MDIKLLSKSAHILSREGVETHRGVEVAIYRDQFSLDEYIRVGSALMWRKDFIESADRLKCISSGMTILL